MLDGEKETTTVAITKGKNSTKELLDQLKVHDNQAYNEIIHEIAKRETLRRNDHK